MSDLSGPETGAGVSSETLVSGGVGPTWQEQDPTLRDMWLSNQPPQAIADALGRSVAAIMTRAARLGLPRRSSPGRKPGQRRQSQSTMHGAASRMTSRTSMATEALHAPPQTSLRVCLMCLNKFESQGRHNRICSTCRNSSEYESASSLADIHFPVS